MTLCITLTPTLILRLMSAFHEEEKEAVTYVFSSIKEFCGDINYLVIFILSVLAILADVTFSHNSSRQRLCGFLKLRQDIPGY